MMFVYFQVAMDIIRNDEDQEQQNGMNVDIETIGYNGKKQSKQN